MKITTEAELDQAQEMVQSVTQKAFDSLRQKILDGEAGDVDFNISGLVYEKDTTPPGARAYMAEPAGIKWTICIDQKEVDENGIPLGSIIDYEAEEQHG